MSRPDTALRRSDELLAVGQPAAALASVYEIIASGKRFRSTPLSSLEPIMFRYLDLCVDLRKGKHAREGLHTYKNAAQNTSVTAVETVIKHFLSKSKAKLDEALAKVDEVAGPDTGSTTVSTQMTKEDGTIQTVEVEDLEEAETPESILLSTVSDEKSRDRTYRTLVTPWLRFLWESYRTALDTLRNNTRLEVLYQQVALEAFQFCLTHGRKTEFRRLCETLRQHFAYTQKYSSQTYAINISDPETLQRYLDIRFAQLNTAVELELWQEAFRSAEDIHGLVAVSKRTPRASMMASFYEKLVKVFAVGQNFLFHAAAYGKLWSLQAATSGHDNPGGDRIAGLVLLSALSVPLSQAHERKVRRDPITGEEKDYSKGRMTLMGLLDLPAAPSRETLLRDARTALKYVSPELRQLYQIIEVDFHPLHITSKLEPIFASLRANPDTLRYVEPLKSVVLSRMFQQLAQVYDSVKLARVIKLATFKDDVNEDGQDATKVRIERFITSACIRGEMSVRLDHVDGIIEFEDKMFEINSSTDSTEAIDFQGSPVDVLQPTPSTLLRTHLTQLAQTLFVSLDTISPSTSALAKAKGNAEAALQAMAANLDKDRDSLLSRRLIADQRKQVADQQAAQREKEAEQARAAARAQQVANEARRVEQEAKAKQLEMIKKNNEAVKAEEAKKLADKLKSIGAIKISDKEIDSLDTAALMRIQVEKMEKDKRDMAEKLRIIMKRIDHTERAFRKEEVPLLHKDYELQQKRDREVFEKSKASRIEDAKNAHAARLALKKKLAPMVNDIEAFKEKRLQATSAQYKKKVQEAKAKIEEEKAARKAAVEKRRKEVEEERKRAEEEAHRREEEDRLRQEEEARQAEEEAAARAAEEARLAEEKKKQEEELAKRRAEREAERAKGDEQARKQREREAEIERKLAEKEAARKAGPVRPVVGAKEWRREETASSAAPGASAAAPSSSGPPKIPGVQPGGWRSRAAQAESTGAVSPAAVASPPDSRSGTPASGERKPLGLQPRTGGAAPSWRDREASRSAAPNDAPPPAARPPPAPRPQEQTNGADEGFKTVAPKKPAGGAYVPPSRRQ